MNGPMKLGREENTKERTSLKPMTRSSASVKGKKEIACNRTTKLTTKEAVGSSRNFSHNTSVKWFMLNTIGDGDHFNGHFQFVATDRAEEGNQPQRQDKGSKSEAQTCDGLVR